MQIQILIPPLPPWEKTNCSSGPRGPPSIIARLSARLCAVCHLPVTRHRQIGHRQRILTTNERLRAPPAATLALSRRAAGSRPTTAASVDAGRARAAERARERHRPGGPRTRRDADRTRSTPNRRPSRRAHARRDARSIRAWRPRPSREFGPGRGGTNLWLYRLHVHEHRDTDQHAVRLGWRPWYPVLLECSSVHRVPSYRRTSRLARSRPTQISP